MKYNIFENRKIDKNSSKRNVPVWFMRQAGRYHQHYQNLKIQHSFMELCKMPKLACEVTLGPIEEFHFDAAILFSDLLFPLEQLGLGLDYDEGPPRIHHHLLEMKDCDNIRIISDPKRFYSFQEDALSMLKNKLPQDCTLLGFVGSPWTLFSYAAEGAHSGNLVSSKKGLHDGRWSAFCDVLLPNLLSNMLIQANAGADAICIFDTAAGELSFFDFEEYVAPKLNWLFKEFKKQSPQCKITYYSKWTNLSYFKNLDLQSIDVLGVDWRIDLTEAVNQIPKHLYIQGNIDPGWLHLPWPTLKNRLDRYYTYLQSKNFPFNRWIAGLGHGVLIKTPQENVKNTVDYIHQHWVY